MIQLVSHDPEIFRILVPLPDNPLRSVNCYLVRSGGECLLVDTGFNCPEGFEALASALESLGIALDSSLRLFITHAHSDHFGLAARLSALGVEVLMHPHEHAFTQQLASGRWHAVLERTLRESGFAEGDVQALLVSNPILDGACGESFPASCVRNGDLLTVGEYAFRCIETPGHSPAHLCLYQEERQILLAGDCVLFRISPNVASFCGDGDNLAAYLESLARLEGLPVRTLLTAHREVTGTLAQRSRELQEHHRQRLRECLDILAEHPSLSCVELAERLTWSPKGGWQALPLGQRMFANGECRAHLEHLAALGLVSRQSAGGVARYRLAAVSPCAPAAGERRAS